MRVSYSSSVSRPLRSILSKRCTTSLRRGGGRQRVDDAIDLAVGDHERRAEGEAVGADPARDHAQLEHAVANLHRVLPGLHTDRPDTEVTPGVVDGAVVGQRS